MSLLAATACAHYAMAAGFTGYALQTAVAVAGAESSWNPDALGDKNKPVKGCHSWGLWQINSCPGRDDGSPHRYGESPSILLDPLVNARAAFAISSGGTNWAPWTAYTSGAYTRYAATAARAITAAQADPEITQRFRQMEQLPRDSSIIGQAKNTVAGAAGTAVETAQAVLDPLAALARIAQALLDQRTWLRVLLVVAGLVAVALAARLIYTDARSTTP